jgi:hypothetical protein
MILSTKMDAYLCDCRALPFRGRDGSTEASWRSDVSDRDGLARQSTVLAASILNSTTSCCRTRMVGPALRIPRTMLLQAASAAAVLIAVQEVTTSRGDEHHPKLLRPRRCWTRSRRRAPRVRAALVGWRYQVRDPGGPSAWTWTSRWVRPRRVPALHRRLPIPARCDSERRPATGTLHPSQLRSPVARGRGQGRAQPTAAGTGEAMRP